jgi:hypothetical protein
LDELPFDQPLTLPKVIAAADFTPIPIDRIAAAVKARGVYLASVQFWTPSPTTAYCLFNFEQLHWENHGILLGGSVHLVGECKPNVI